MTPNSDSFAKNIKGVAGVHLVVAQLSLKGYVALPTTRNLKSIDIVAFNKDLSRFGFLQVKSTDKPKNGWPVYTIGRDVGWEEDIQNAISLGQRFFYVFVSLPSGDIPETSYYIVPSNEVAEMVTADIRNWLNTHPDRKPSKQLLAWSYGGPTPDSDRRFKNRWDLLLTEYSYR